MKEEPEEFVTEKQMVEMLMNSLQEEYAVRSCRSYEEAGVLTKNAGFVVRMPSGNEFQVTVVRSR